MAFVSSRRILVSPGMAACGPISHMSLYSRAARTVARWYLHCIMADFITFVNEPLPVSWYFTYYDLES
jgi:hypothetical protein